jgi:hypothetical protein
MVGGYICSTVSHYLNHLFSVIMNVKYCEKCLLYEHKYNHKQLHKFSEDELKEFPLEYLIEESEPIELLYAWHKLPWEYRSDFRLQTQLPCFVHYNRPEWTTHIDGPPTSQSRCHLCKFVLNK